MILWHIVLLLGSLLLMVIWEQFNFTTTHLPLIAMFGNSEAVTILATVVVGVDVLFLAHIMIRAFVARSERETIYEALRNDPITRAIGMGWSIVTALDVFLTWFFMASEMEFTIGTNVQAPSAVVEFIPLFPIIIAVLTWLTQAALVVTIGRVIQRVVYGVAKANNRAKKQYGKKTEEIPWPSHRKKRKV